METRFRYEGLRAAIMVFGFLAFMGIATSVAPAFLRREGQDGCEVAGIGLLLFFVCSLVGYGVALNLSDVIVSDMGLSRSLWGRTLQEMRWDDVTLIKVSWMQNRYSGVYRNLRVFSHRAARGGLRRTISFAEQGDLRALIEHMNRHIAARRIPVEVEKKRDRLWAHPEWIRCDRIDPTP
jgi:hypothetical protein